MFTAAEARAMTNSKEEVERLEKEEKLKACVYACMRFLEYLEWNYAETVKTAAIKGKRLATVRIDPINESNRAEQEYFKSKCMDELIASFQKETGFKVTREVTHVPTMDQSKLYKSAYLDFNLTW